MHYPGKIELKKSKKGNRERMKYIAAFLFALMLTAVMVFALGDNNQDYDDLYVAIEIIRGQRLENALPVEPELAGHRFSHWSSDPEGVPFDLSQQLFYETTLYAIWVTEGEYPYNIDDHGYHRYGDYYGYTYENVYDEEETITIRFLWNRGYLLAYDENLYHDENFYHHDYELGYFDYADYYYVNHEDYYHANDTGIYQDYNSDNQHYQNEYYQNEYYQEDAYETVPEPTGESAINLAPDTFIGVDIDSRGNVSIYPQIGHRIILDGDYIHVRIPIEHDLDLINVNIPDDWSYELSHEGSDMPEAEEYDYAEGYDYLGDTPYEVVQTYTVITVSHTWNQGEDFAGFMPFASNAPPGFTMVTLASPFAPQDWNDALFGAQGNSAGNHRVVVIPQNVTIPAEFALSGNRHIIIVSQGTNLHERAYNHTAPPTVFAITHVLDGTGRHFTLANTTTLTLSHVILDGGVPIPNTAPLRGGISMVAGSHLNMLSGSVIRNSRAGAGGGLTAAGATGTITMSGNSSITGNSTTGLGGGVHISGGRQITMTENSSITNNTAGTDGGGINLSANNARVVMEDSSSISGNTARSGGGVMITTNGGRLYMMDDNTVISGNIANGTLATQGGGGVHVSGANSRLNFSSGSIINNHAVSNGGGVYASTFSYSAYLPNPAYAQLYINSAAIFNGNTSGFGSFNPPVNAVEATNIATTAQRSGGFDHALNNLDINFIFFVSDWSLLMSIITSTDAANIVIHPTGTTGVTQGLVGTTYNLIISDPGDGHTITTIHLEGGTTVHTINVARPVTIQAATGQNIVIRMPAPGAPNTPDIPPWATSTAILNRMFNVAANGNLTIGGPGSGTLTLDGNASQVAGTAARGGVMLNAVTSVFNLGQGGVIYNSRSTTGGAVQISANGAHFHMNGGSITSNFGTVTTAASGGGGVALTTNGAQFTMNSGTISGNIASASGGGVAITTSGGHFTMHGGTISGNTSNGAGVTSGGGGVFINGAASTFTFNAGSIINNQAANEGGGVFASVFTHGNLSDGMHYPQLTVLAPAIFNGNTTNSGGFEPPSPFAQSNTSIAVTAQRSGGFWHPLNNLDINFRGGDWVALNNLVDATVLTAPTPDRIIIHPAGTSGVTPGLAGDGVTYNMIISAGNGSTITTIPIRGAAAADPHRINVLREVRIEAAPGANIMLNMTALEAPNATVNLGRHFLVGASGNLTLGGPGSGTLTLNGNIALAASGTRGGITINNATGQVTLAQGSVIANSRAANGGGITLNSAGSQLTMSGGSITGNTATASGGGVSIATASTFTMISGSISGNTGTTSGGGVSLNANNAIFNMEGGTISGNFANGTTANTNGGGGVALITAGAQFTMDAGTISGNTVVSSGGGVLVSTASIFTLDGGTITGNYANSATTTAGGGGVALSANNAIFNMLSGSITNNNAASSGGGVGLLVNGALFIMESGSISGNTSHGTAVASGGGGVFIGAGAISHFTFQGGSIQNNHSATNGGGIFSTSFTYVVYLPMGAYPQLTVLAAASFSGNTAAGGGFNPPGNAVEATSIEVTTQRSGGFEHPLNNLDINFTFIVSDWALLNGVVSGTNAVNIVIHPTGTTSVTQGMTGTTYNIIISDPGDGSTITTVPTTGTTNQHAINVSRNVTISAAPGADIVFRMPLPNSPNTPNIPPWSTTFTTLTRHFNIFTGGVLTLGGGTGTVTVDGNASLFITTLTQRGGITVNSGGHLILQTGSAIYNNRSTSGGGIGTGFDALVTIDGGRIIGNTATGLTFGSGGGGVLIAPGASLIFNSGMIANNHASADGGGIFVVDFSYGSPLPAGAHFPLVNISDDAVFMGNTAGNGGVLPPGNAAVYTNIAATAQVSGGFDHPLNNLDINFEHGDWHRLNTLINSTTIGHIIIHPTGSSVTPGLAGTVYHMIVSDQGNGSTITSVQLIDDMWGWIDTHPINVSRTVTIEAAPLSNIALVMAVTDTPEIPVGRHFNVMENGNLTLGGGAAVCTLTLNGNADNGLIGFRGGVTINAANGVLNMAQGGIITNSRFTNGGGVAVAVSGAQLNMIGGSITNNTATASGGGVALAINGAQMTMTSGIISGNNSANHGGGVHLVLGAASHFNFSGGSIINNHANGDGGGIFTMMFTYENPLPLGSYPQLTVGPGAIFNGNTAGNGGFQPPSNPTTPYTNIAVTAQRSGGFGHPLNNLDINFMQGDWVRLNTLINTPVLDGGPERIVIHPTGSGVPAGMAGDGITYNFIIADAGNGSTITTVPITGAPVASDAHRINVLLRTVEIEAAPSANIVFNMSIQMAPGGAVNMGRHFFVGAGGHLTLGGGTGTITLNANADTLIGNRGGVHVNATTGHLTLAQGATISNGRAASGGGVQLTTNGAQLTMSGGSISGNFANDGGGVHLAAGANSRLNFNSGTIQNNHANNNGGGVFTATFTYLNPLPDNAMHYPQLIISASANFIGNTAGGGSFPPPTNAVAQTLIAETAQVSGGFTHPLNNWDINFVFGDWARLNNLITTTAEPNPQRIVIHPTGTTDVAHGMAGDGITYNLIISDGGDGSTIHTTITSGSTHRIYVQNRTVFVEARPDSNILLSMMTPLSLPSGGTRHFSVGQNGNLTLGGDNSGTLTITAHRDLFTGNRGGTNAYLNGVLNLRAGVVIRGNNSGGSPNGTGSGDGGGVHVSNDAVVNIYDGALITDNFATNGGGGLSFSMELTPVINIWGGTISYNQAQFGGGIWAMAGTVNMYDGAIINNTAGVTTTGSPFMSNPHGAGGGIRVCCSGHLFLHGGTISNNTARFGGGVHLSHEFTTAGVADGIPSRLTMSGGSINGNHSTLSHIPPAAMHLDFPNNEDGGAVFITESGEFTMTNPVSGGTNEIHISHNTADRHGGGVYWEVGLWTTVGRTQPVTLAYNEAEEDGGAIFLSYKYLEMFGEWRIDRNRANRGGGVFLHGDNTPMNPSISNDPHPNRGAGTLIMHGGRIFENESRTSGGGVYIYRDAIFNMLSGSIENNTSALYGGGVYVFNPGIHFTSRFHAYGGYIRGNTAIYGGGVYLMYRAHLFATNVRFMNNTAHRMGGAIFTELVDYGYLLSGQPVPHNILFPTPPDPLEEFEAFDNIITTNTVRFSGNEAMAAFHSPYNALEMLPDIQWYQWNVPGQAHAHLSIHTHPFNNFDINYVRPVYFYKTDMEIYSTPSSINNLAGAVFELDIWNEDTGQWDFYATATSENNGRVALFVFDEGDFRLREVTPPTGFELPPGHWLLSMGFTNQFLFMVDAPPTPSVGNEEFSFVRLDRETEMPIEYEYSQEARMRWHVGNTPPREAMLVHKANQEIIGTTPTTVAQIDDILLPGAVFALYRYIGDGTPLDNVLVPSPGWVRTQFFHHSTGNPNEPIVLNIASRLDQSYSYYQLVEIFAPVNYAVPFGQWRIRMDVVDLAARDFNLTVQTIGDVSTPTLMRLTGELTRPTFAVGNRRGIDLPMTGGLGSFGTTTMAVTATGLVLVLTAVMMTYLYVTKKKARAVSSVARRGKLDS